MTDYDRSTAKRDAAIIGLLEETTIRAAADRAGIGEATLRRWLREDEDFQRRYMDARAEVFSQALNQLRQGALESAITLREIARSESVAPRTRVSASQAILNSLFRGLRCKGDAEHADSGQPLVIVRFGEGDREL